MTTTKKEPEVVTTKKDQHEKEPEVVNTKKEPEVVTTKKDPEVVNTKKNRKWPLTFDLWPLTLTRKKTNLLLLSFIIKSCLHKYKNNKCNTLSTSHFSKSNVVFKGIRVHITILRIFMYNFFILN